MEFQHQTHLVRDASLQVWTGGKGRKLLFLHGAGGAADFFSGTTAAPFLEQLANSFQVIVTEHPGFGAQDRPAWLENIHDLAYFYLDALEILGLDDVHLVGHSLGGWLALEIAVRNTGRLASLTLVGAAGVRVPGVPKGDIFLWSRDDFARNMFRNEDAARAFLAKTMTQEQERIFLRNRETTALLAWQPRLFDPHLHKWLHRIDVPTHVIWADDDRVLPLPYGKAIAAGIEGAQLSLINNCGHLAHLDRPADFSDRITGFLKDIKP